MKKHEIEPPLTHALNEHGELKYVREVPIGDACGCICPKCKEPLIAKHCYNEGKIPHFAHVSGKVCIGAQMSANHLRAQQIIVENKSVMASAYKNYNGTVSARQLVFVDVKSEERNEWEGIRPDVYGITADGNKWAVEIYYTNRVDIDKESKIKELGVSCLEIDISNQTFDSLEDFLLNTDDYRWWVNNPNYDLILYKKEWERVKTITSVLLSKQTIKIPDVSNIKNIQSQSLLFVAKNELNTIIKFQTTDGCVYAVFVGTYCSVDLLYDYLRNKLNNYTGVLAAYTDEILNYNIDPKKDYNYKWLIKKELVGAEDYKIRNVKEVCNIKVGSTSEEKKYNEYMKQSGMWLLFRYSGKNYSCELQRDCKQCDFCKDIVIHNGEEYSVCDNGKMQESRRNLIKEPAKNNVVGGYKTVYKDYSMPHCNTIEDYYSYLQKKGVLNWNGRDNNIVEQEISPEKTALYVIHQNEQYNKYLFHLTKFTNSKYCLCTETISSSYEQLKKRLSEIMAERD